MSNSKLFKKQNFQKNKKNMEIFHYKNKLKKIRNNTKNKQNNVWMSSIK